MKATTLPEVIRYFNPMQPLRDQGLIDWYIDRPGNPLDSMQIYLQGLALADMPVKVLFTGHTGSGKSTALNKLAEGLKRQFFIVPFEVREWASISDLNYVDLLLGMAMSLFKRASEPEVLGQAPAQIVAGIWEDISGFIEKIIFGPTHFRAAPPETELGAKVNFLAVEFQTKFAAEATTREAVRQRIEPRLAELHTKINDVSAEVQVRYKRPVLFFVEGTDKTDLSRARDIFLHHTYTLTAFRPSVIYTFPIALRYSKDFRLLRDSFHETFLMPNLKVHNRDRTPNPEGRDLLAQALSVRLAEGLMQPEAQTEIVHASGGLMRTLIRLTQRAAVNALGSGNGVITVENARYAIQEERGDYIAGLSRVDYPLLYQRHLDRELSADEGVLRLLETRALLEYANGNDPWCDVHPIALPLVLERLGKDDKDNADEAG